MYKRQGDAREQDAGLVRGNGPVTRPAALGGDVLKERDGLLVIGHEGSPETDIQQIHARQGRRFALGKVKDILEGDVYKRQSPRITPTCTGW